MQNPATGADVKIRVSRGIRTGRGRGPLARGILMETAIRLER